jgi:hypothetical protein
MRQQHLLLLRDFFFLLGSFAILYTPVSVTLDIPLFIRLLEYAREDAQADVDLHFIADNAIRLSAEGETLTMDHYDQIVKQDETKSAD